MGNVETIQSLTTRPGVAALIQHLQSAGGFFNEPQQSANIAPTVQRYLKTDPRLGRVHFRKNLNTVGNYNPSSDTVSVGVNNPAVVGHELGHARNLRDAPTYSKLVQAVQNLANINTAIALPAMLAIRALVSNPDTQREIFNIASGASAMLAAPGLVEEVAASVDAVKHAPDKLQAIKTLAPAFLTHAVHSLAPTAIYQFGKHI